VATPRFRLLAHYARNFAVATFVAAVAIAHVQDARSEPPKELKLSVAVGPAYALGKAALHWANHLGEKSGGALLATVFPGASLAQRDPARELTALRSGAADLAVGSTLYWSAQVDALGVVGLPWLAAEPRQVDALIGSPVADMLMAAVQRAGIVPLALAPLGHRQLAVRERLIRTPGDLAGMQVRIAGPPQLAELFATLGARAQVMAFADAQAAFTAGTLDAQDGTPAMFATTRLNAVGVQRVVLWDAIAEAALFAVNRERWEAWTAAEQAFVRDAARETAAELADLLRQENEAALAALKKGGISVTRLTPAERAAFAAATRDLYTKRAAVAGEELARAAEAAVKSAAP
jgi:TRAP-type C4-dicarboxylate transport system substrate-binding protein